MIQHNNVSDWHFPKGKKQWGCLSSVDYLESPTIQTRNTLSNTYTDKSQCLPAGKKDKLERIPHADRPQGLLLHAGQARHAPHAQINRSGTDLHSHYPRRHLQ